MNSIKNIARVTGLLYGLIEILAFSSTFIPKNSSQVTTVSTILEGLVSRVEIIGGIWFLLITALLTRRLPKPLNYLGVVTGVAGIITVVPALEVLKNGFRLGEFVWSVWLGVVMFRSSQSVVARKCRVFFGVSEVVPLEGGRQRII